MAFPLLIVSACHDSDDSTPATTQAATFAAGLDRAQEVSSTTLGSRVRITVRNAAPDMGTFQTPVWVALHDGTWDPFDLAAPASAELERLAEDGNLDPLIGAFAASSAGFASGTAFGAAGPVVGPISPGEAVSVSLRVDKNLGAPIYFSYLSMVIPSNDAFVGNADPTAHPIYDANGNFIANNFVVPGAEVLDAGTELNDEIPANTAFFGQTTPNTGVLEVANILAHLGYLSPGLGGILDDPMFANADFAETLGYEMLDVRFQEETPTIEPSGVSSFALNAANDALTFDLVAVGLSGPATGLHLHQGAIGVAGPVLFDLMSFVTSNTEGSLHASGSMALTSQQAAALLADGVYINLHTDLNPNGEIRGQVSKGTVFATPLDMSQQVPTPVLGTDVRVIVQNRAPSLGTFQTPVWVGFHSGAFDLFNAGASASAALERLAEDGDAAPLNSNFLFQMQGERLGSIAGTQVPGPIAPLETASSTFRLNPTNPMNRYMTLASMILPSNDAFLGNDDPLAHPLFDSGGAFVGSDFVLTAGNAWDAGTEVNDELPANTAFFGQTTPDTGTTEGGSIAVHPGFLAAGLGGILDDPMFANADFANTLGYEFLRVALREGPTPTTPTGSISLTIGQDGVSAVVRVAAIHLSSRVTSMHLHRGTVGNTGPIEINLTPFIVLNEGGQLVNLAPITLTPDLVSAIRNGEIYVNVHTELNPGGEIRGQL